MHFIKKLISYLKKCRPKKNGERKTLILEKKSHIQVERENNSSMRNKKSIRKMHSAQFKVALERVSERIAERGKERGTFSQANQQILY